MHRCVPLTVLALACLAFTLPSAAADQEVPLPDDEKCAPPCGYIYPTIGLDAEIKKEQLRTSKIFELPEEIPVHVSYSWDMEQDGTGAPGNADPMKITVIVSKKPTWLAATLEPSVCEFQLIPVQNEYEVCTLTLKIKVDPAYVPTREADLDVVGKRLMLFATSEESGTFKKSYGVEDMRWTWDGPPILDSQPVAGLDEGFEQEAAPAAAPALLVLALAALLGRARRR